MELHVQAGADAEIARHPDRDPALTDEIGKAQLKATPGG
jgi:hypothetical protein